MTRALVVAVVVLASCGGVPDAPCTKEGESTCSGVSVLYCESGKWVPYACPTGCNQVAASKCDWMQMPDKTACPAAEENAESICSNDGEGTTCLQTSRGRLWRVLPCQNCVKGKKASEVLSCSNGICACQ